MQIHPCRVLVSEDNIDSLRARADYYDNHLEPNSQYQLTVVGTPDADSVMLYVSSQPGILAKRIDNKLVYTFYLKDACGLTLELGGTKKELAQINLNFASIDKVVAVK